MALLSVGVNLGLAPATTDHMSINFNHGSKSFCNCANSFVCRERATLLAAWRPPGTHQAPSLACKWHSIHTVHSKFHIACSSNGNYI